MERRHGRVVHTLEVRFRHRAGQAVHRNWNEQRILERQKLRRQGGLCMQNEDEYVTRHFVDDLCTPCESNVAFLVNSTVSPTQAPPTKGMKNGVRCLLSFCLHF